LFDVKWYLEQNPGVAAAGIEPFKHYVTEGWRSGRAPGPHFDRTRSRGNDSEPRHSQLGNRNERETDFALSPFPLVSIVVTNLNGSRHLPGLFESLRTQTYRNFEIIFVDDNSSDDSVKRARVAGADHIIETRNSVGFARANDLAMSKCSGELIALLNNDTSVDPNWLEAMVGAIKQGGLIAAVAPKMRFWTKFHRVRIRGSDQFKINVHAIVNTLEYKKYFVRIGTESNGWIDATKRQCDHLIEIDIPLQDNFIDFLLRTIVEQTISIKVGAVSKTLLLEPDDTRYEFAFSKSDRREGFHIINNAGSFLSGPLSPADRGFGHVDEGQFDHPEDVDLFCGGAALIRRDALHGPVDGIEVHCALDGWDSCTVVGVHGDCFVAEVAGEACFPVVLEAGRE
jgi:GT2 family glycosyltransferase